jgi:hypothetical protein
MNQKGEISSQVFTYILAAIIVGLILLVGYKGITTVLSVTSKAPIDDFRSDFTSTVNKMARDFGSIKKYEFSLPSQIEEVCFIDSMNDENKFDIPSSAAKNSFIKYSIDDNVQKNVFLIKEGKIEESFYVDDLNVVTDYLCIENSGLMYAWFEGKGRKACMKKEQTVQC